MDWSDIPVYRKRPARYKAVQYLEGDELPKDVCAVLGDWIVLDVLKDNIFVLKDDVFDLVFEQD